MCKQVKQSLWYLVFGKEQIILKCLQHTTKYHYMKCCIQYLEWRKLWKEKWQMTHTAHKFTKRDAQGSLCLRLVVGQKLCFQNTWQQTEIFFYHLHGEGYRYHTMQFFYHFHHICGSSLSHRINWWNWFTHLMNRLMSSSLSQAALQMRLSSESGCTMPRYAAWHVSR